MRYNTQLEKIRMTEYGRYIQEVIDYLPKIEDKKLRSNIAAEIVQVMSILIRTPFRTNPETQRKIWDHLHIISQFMLDIDSPFPKPAPPEEIKPHPLTYSNPDEIKFKYHGEYLQKIFEKLKTMENGPEKEELLRLTVILMKKFYYAWNKEFPKDEVILEQIKTLSNGSIVITREKLEQIQESYKQNKENRNGYYNIQRKRNHKFGHSK